MNLTYVALHEVTWCMVVWCTQNLRRDGSSFMWPAMPALSVHHFLVKKKKKSHSCRITCERSESARERRIALYKSDHQSISQPINPPSPPTHPPLQPATPPPHLPSSKTPIPRPRYGEGSLSPTHSYEHRCNPGWVVASFLTQRAGLGLW